MKDGVKKQVRWRLQLDRCSRCASGAAPSQARPDQHDQKGGFESGSQVSSQVSSLPAHQTAGGSQCAQVLHVKTSGRLPAPYPPCPAIHHSSHLSHPISFIDCPSPNLLPLVWLASWLIGPWWNCPGQASAMATPGAGVVPFFLPNGDHH